MKLRRIVMEDLIAYRPVSPSVHLCSICVSSVAFHSSAKRAKTADDGARSGRRERRIRAQARGASSGKARIAGIF